MNNKLLNYFKGDELAANVFLSKYAQEGEGWKFLEDGKHAVSNLGRVANIGTLHIVGSRNRKGKVEPFLLKSRLSSNRYYITFDNNLIHRLIAINFIENPDNYDEINHIDGNKLNNDINNLEWCSRSKNIKHSYTNKLRVKKPEESSKLTELQVKRVRYLHSKLGFSYEKILKILNLTISKGQIGKIINYKQWK